MAGVLSLDVRMDRPAAVALLCAVLLWMGACSRKAAHAVSGEAASVDYRRALAGVAGAEAEALAAVASATGDHYRDDATLLAVLRRTALPRYRAFVDGLGATTPAAPELAVFHSQLLAVAREELDLLGRLERAVAAGDGTTVLFVNREQERVARKGEALVVEMVTMLTPPPPSAAEASASGP